MKREGLSDLKGLRNVMTLVASDQPTTGCENSRQLGITKRQPVFWVSIFEHVGDTSFLLEIHSHCRPALSTHDRIVTDYCKLEPPPRFGRELFLELFCLALLPCLLTLSLDSSILGNPSCLSLYSCRLELGSPASEAHIV